MKGFTRVLGGQLLGPLLYFFSTALLTPISRESMGELRTFDILTGEYEINMKMLRLDTL